MRCVGVTGPRAGHHGVLNAHRRARRATRAERPGTVSTRLRLGACPHGVGHALGPRGGRSRPGRSFGARPRDAYAPRHRHHRQAQLAAHVVQLGQERRRVGRSPGRVARGHPGNEAVQNRGHAPLDRGRRRDVLVHVLVGHRHRVRSRVRLPPGEQLEQHHPGRVHVRTRVGVAAAELLGRAVGHRAHHQPGPGGRGVRLHRPGQPEVGHLHQTVVGEQDVLGFDVAVHQPGAVRRGQRGEHRLHERHRLAGGQRAHVRG